MIRDVYFPGRSVVSLLTVVEGHSASHLTHDYSRGNIRILDDAGLEAASCSCYELVSDRAPARA